MDQNSSQTPSVAAAEKMQYSNIDIDSNRDSSKFDVFMPGEIVDK